MGGKHYLACGCAFHLECLSNFLRKKTCLNSESKNTEISYCPNCLINLNYVDTFIINNFNEITAEAQKQLGVLITNNN